MCDQDVRDVPLPPRWLGKVKSAAPYVISLAHYAIAYGPKTRSDLRAMFARHILGAMDGLQ